MPRQSIIGISPSDWSEEVNAAFPATPILDIPSQSPMQHELYDRYIQHINEYISSLNNENSVTQRDVWEADESEIVSLMYQLGFFTGIESALSNIDSLRVNTRYDHTNLKHRFLVSYLSSRIRFDSARDLINHRPSVSQCHDMPARAFVRSDLDFLATDPLQPTNDPLRLRDTDLRIIGADDEIDFIVNNQKLKLTLQTMSNRNAPSRYIAAINLRITSERRTNVRQAIRLEQSDRNLVFKRLNISRPLHGFKFVRRDGGGLIIKEIN